MRLTAIIKLLTPEAEQEGFDLFSETVQPEVVEGEVPPEVIPQEYHYCRVPSSNRYTRVIISPQLGETLQWKKTTGVPLEHVEIVRVEWDGQDIVDGQEQLFQTGEMDVLDEENNVIGTQPVYLGRFA